MLLALPSTMTRNLLALAIVLVIAGLAPATAIIGFCARMPCCSHASDATTASSTQRNDCCTTIACYESPSATFAAAASTSLSLVVTPLITRDVPALHAPRSTRGSAAADTSPPRRTRARLAVLSTLLI
jgi:hypothetical protein